MTLEKAFDMARTYPEAEQQRVINFVISIQSEKFRAAKIADFEAKMEKSQQWAKEIGLTPDDVTRAIKEVRKEKRQSK